MKLTEEFKKHFIEAFESCIGLFKQFDEDQKDFTYADYAKGYVKAILTDSFAGITLTSSITGYFLGKEWDICDYEVEDIIVLLTDNYGLE